MAVEAEENEMRRTVVEEEEEVDEGRARARAVEEQEEDHLA